MDIVIVSWNVSAAVRQCLISIRQHASTANVVVVDNASTDGTVAMVGREFPEITVIRNSRNVGFARACNQGAALGKQSVILFLNPDAQLCSDAGDMLQTMFEEQPFVGIIGPKILNIDGSVQPSVRRFPTPLSFLWELLKLKRLLPGLGVLRKNHMEEFRYNTLRAVDQVMGAAFAVRRSLYETLQGFDERFFIWFEEVDFCYRAHILGWLIFFVPDLTVIHRRGASFEQRSIVWRYLRYSQSGIIYFWLRKRYFALLFIVLVAVTFLPVIMVSWPFIALHKRSHAYGRS